MGCDRPTLKKTVLAVTGGFRTAKGMAEAIREEACQSESINVSHKSITPHQAVDPFRPTSHTQSSVSLDLSPPSLTSAPTSFLVK